MAPDALLICRHMIQETLSQTDDLTLRKQYISFNTFNYQEAWSATEHMPETRHLEAIMALAKFFLGPAPTPQAPEPTSSWPRVAVPEEYQPQLHHAPHGSRPCPVDWLPAPTSGLPHHREPARQSRLLLELVRQLGVCPASLVWVARARAPAGHIITLGIPPLREQPAPAAPWQRASVMNLLIKNRFHVFCSISFEVPWHTD